MFKFKFSPNFKVCFGGAGLHHLVLVGCAAVVAVTAFIAGRVSMHAARENEEAQALPKAPRDPPAGAAASATDCGAHVTASGGGAHAKTSYRTKTMAVGGAQISKSKSASRTKAV